MEKENGTNEKNKNWVILLIVLMSAFMASLDGSIVNVALPRMARELQVTTSTIQLVSVSYLIVIGGTVLIFGRLGDIWGKTAIFKLGMVIFTIGSLFCGLANSFSLLILARIIQGIGAAGAMATNQGIITETYPATERGKALGFIGTAVALGSLVGPGLGGIIVGMASWEFIFLINVPIGIIALYYTFKYLPKGHKKPKGKLDFLGAALFMFSIVPLFISLNGGLKRGFGDPLILGGFAVALVSFLLFLHVERKKEDPLVHLEIFENKLFSLSIFCGFITFVAIFCNNIILPFYLQDVMAYEPQFAGLIMMIYPILLTVVAPASGHLSDRVGSEMLTLAGLLLISGGLFLMSTLGEHSSILTMGIYIGIMSIGMGLFQSPNNSLVMSTVPRNKLGIAGSINALIRNLGMVCGIALATTMLYSLMGFKLGYRAMDYVPGRNDAFLFGMHWVYVTAGLISLFGAGLTFYRLRWKREKGEPTEGRRTVSESIGSIEG